MNRLALTFCFTLITWYGLAQCEFLSPSITLDFNALGTCAPVEVDKFEVTYTFTIPQDPNMITIRFIWNDPANTTEDATIANGKLTASSGNTKFDAAASNFQYPTAGTVCFYEAQAFVIVDTDQCDGSEQTQPVPSWNNDSENGGQILIDPAQYHVCEANAIANVTFDDASVFNCNAADNPDNPNILERHTQFVYGTNTGLADANRIKNLEIDDGGVIQLTTATGAYDASSTRGGVTAAYFGSIDQIAAPAAGPNSVSVPLSAPDDVNNVAGNTFQITLYNWNTCNPYNGDSANPNYADAVSQVIDVTMIAPPVPSYLAREGGAGGATPTEFCINEDIYFENQTGGGFNFVWQFYDGSTTSDPLLGTSTDNNPTFSFNSGGSKLVRLIATDPNADGSCDEIYDDLVTLSPAAVADFEFTDAGFGAAPVFCQTGADVFTIGFQDNTTIVADTEVRYEFYNEGNPPTSGMPDDFGPGGGAFVTTNIAPFSKDYSAEQFVVVRYVARNTSTLCSSFDQDTIFVYGQPIPTFASNEACAGNRTTFSAITNQTTGFTTRVNDDIIDTYEWDFSYDMADGFNVELTRNNDTGFDWHVGTVVTPEVEPVTSEAGTYTVALRTTTQKGMCSDLITGTVIVNENPDSQLAYDVSGDLCPGDLITFTNNSVNPSFTMVYSIEVVHTPSLFSSSTNLITADTSLVFSNPDDTTRTYEATLRSTTEDLCETLSTPLIFRILPDEDSGFTDDNYDLFNSNCSPWSSMLQVDAVTQSLAPDSYQWTISDEVGVIAGFPVTKVSTDPDFHQLDYDLTNTTNAIISFEVVLEVTKTGVCIANDTFNLQISPQPGATFDLLRDEDCDEVVLELEANQKGLTEYTWIFDPAPDNEFGSDDQRLISYTRDINAGSDINATVRLVTTNLAGCPSDTITIMETVEKRKPDITSSFTISSDTVQLPDATVSIVNTSTPDAGYTYLWEYGDGETSATRDPADYTYSQFGSFQIRLTIADEFCEVESFQTIVVLPADPVLDFEADTLQGCTPLTIQFTNLSQNARSGEFLWEFGDGGISELDNPIHTYFDGGSYDVRLRGTNNVGVTMETEKAEYIEAFGRPFADFLVSSRIVFIPDDEVHFRNLSKNSTEYFWDFGDGSTSTESEPSHAYLQEGTYDVMLVAINELGCSDTLFREAEIEAIIGGETNSPNAFTPNLSGPNGGVDDGGLNVNSVNDIFLPKLEGVVRFKMFVYNKWGQLLFKSEDQNIGWDGYFKGKLAPAGVYIYKLEVRYSDNRDEVIAGDVTLIR